MAFARDFDGSALARRPAWGYLAPLALLLLSGCSASGDPGRPGGGYEDHAGSPPDKGDCHFDMTTTQDFGNDLAAALQSISGTALTCEFDVPKGEGGASVDFTRVNVRYTQSDGTEVEVPQDANGDCQGGAQGWQYSRNNTKIVLCGAVCDEVKADAKAKVDIVLGCETVTIR